MFSAVHYFLLVSALLMAEWSLSKEILPYDEIFKQGEKVFQDPDRSLKNKRDEFLQYENQGDQESKSYIYYVISQFEYQLGNQNKALEYFDKVAKSPKTDKNAKWHYQASISKALTLVDLGRVEEIPQILDRLLKEIDRSLDLWSFIDATMVYGYYHQIIGNYHDSLKYLLEAYRLTDQLEQEDRRKEMLIGVTNMLAGTYVLLNKSNEAIGYYKNLIPLLEGAKAFDNLSTIYYNIGLAYRRLKDFDEAKEYFLKSYDLAQEIKNPSAAAHASYGMGLLLVTTEEYRDSVHWLEKANQYFTTANSQTNMHNTNLQLARAYRELGQTQKAHKILESLLAFYEKINDIEGQRLAYEELAKIYENTDSLQALTNLKKGFELYKKIYDNKLAKETEALRVEFDSERIEKDNQLKKVQLETERQLNQKQQIFIFTMLAISVVLVALLGYLWRAKHIINRQAQSLELRKAELQNILDNIDEAIITIDSQAAIKPDYSHHSEEILATKPDKLSIGELLERLGISPDTCSQTRDILRAAFGEPMLAWEMNYRNLPRSGKNGDQQYLLHWTPVIQKDVVAEVILARRDATTSIALAREAKNRDSILSAVNAGRRGFIFIQELSSQLPKHGTMKDSPEGSLQTIHTIKGEARNLGFKEVQDYLYRLEQAIKQNQFDSIPRLTEDLQGTISQLEVSYEKIYDQAKEMKRTLTQFIGECLQNAEERLLAIDLALAIKVETNVSLDSQQELRVIETILNHGINNCVDHGFLKHLEAFSKSGRSPNISVEIKTLDQYHYLTISDNGVGIDFTALEEVARRNGISWQSKEELLRLLKKHGISTLDQTKQSESSGHGLGLAAAASSVAQLNGEINLFPGADGIGSQLIVRWPIPSKRLSA